MTYRITGPRCQCGKPLTPADKSECARCVGLARAVGREFESGRLSEETWEDFRRWLEKQ